MKNWAERFGYGRSTGIGFEEVEGLIPSAFWKKETLKENWYTGDTYNLSIGQGYLLVTPLQVTQATSTIANNGYLCKPKLLKNEKPECEKLPISHKTLKSVQEGMKKACATGGTGWPLFQFKVKSDKLKVQEIQTACKTGTAESQSKTTNAHAWFTVYAPAENPEIILTVLVEEGGQGSDIAGPIARDILKAYFERKE
jgi:penicillin-binding protein 2